MKKLILSTVILCSCLNAENTNEYEYYKKGKKITDKNIIINDLKESMQNEVKLRNELKKYKNIEKENNELKTKLQVCKEYLEVK